MNLKRSLDAFIERADPGITLGARKPPDTSLRGEFVADLDRARRLSTWWCVLVVSLTIGLGVASLLVQGVGRVGSLSAAGGLGFALLRIWRQKFAMDVLVALLKGAGQDPKEWRQIAAVFRSRL